MLVVIAPREVALVQCNQQGEAYGEDGERDEEVAVGEDGSGGLEKWHAQCPKADG
jgi:hypothetical protein